MPSLNSDRHLEYQMAARWADGVLNPCGMRWSAAEILYPLDDSGSTILLVDGSSDYENLPPRNIAVRGPNVMQG